MLIQLQRQPRLQHLADHPAQKPPGPGQPDRLTRLRPRHQLRRQIRHHLIRQHQTLRRHPRIPRDHPPKILDLADPIL